MLRYLHVSVISMRTCLISGMQIPDRGRAECPTADLYQPCHPSGAESHPVIPPDPSLTRDRPSSLALTARLTAAERAEPQSPRHPAVRGAEFAGETRLTRR